MWFKSDIEIAQEAKPQDIREIAKKLGLTEDDLELYGKYNTYASIENSDIEYAGKIAAMWIRMSANDYVVRSEEHTSELQSQR